MEALLGQRVLPSDTAARIGTDVANDPNRAWIVAGGILLLAIIAAAWWYAKHG